MRDYIEIQRDLVPYQFGILLADEWFDVYIDYNKTAQMYTISLYKDDERVATEPLVLGSRLFRDVYQPGGRFPAIELMPYGPTEREITYDNLGKSVHLTIDDEGE